MSRRNSNGVLLLLVSAIIAVVLGYLYFRNQVNKVEVIPGGLEIPEVRADDDVIIHTAFTLSYNEEHEQASWVAYELTRDELADNFKREKIHFKPDPKVKTGSATDDDYRGNGFDRGHLAPAGDMNFSLDALKESFYFSNISPQVRKFNSGIWKSLEEKTRDWAGRFGSVYVVTGPILEDNLRVIGGNEVSVPRRFYKAILVFNKNFPPNAIAFLMENKSSRMPLKDFAIPVDSLEQILRRDLFPLVDDEFEQKIEKEPQISFWFD